MSTTIGEKRAGRVPERELPPWATALLEAGPSQRAKIHRAWSRTKGTPRKLLGDPAADAPWSWGFPSYDGTDLAAVIDAIDPTGLPEVLRDAESARELRLRRLAAAYQLPGWASRLSADRWWEALAAIVSAVADVPPAGPLEDLLDHAELPWLMARICAPAPRLAKRLGRAARKRLSQIADTELDGNGLPFSPYWGDLLPWLAAWTRCQMLADSLDETCHDAEAQVQYEWMVREALRMTRGDGSLRFARPDNAGTPEWSPSILREALKWGGDRADETIAETKLRLLEPAPAKRSGCKKKLPEPSVYSEWSQGALFRSSWKRNHLGLAVTHDGPTMAVELEVRRRRIMSGEVATQVRIDGKPLALEEEWHNTCAFSEDGIEYVEFERHGPDGWRLQRQIAFAGGAKVVLWADALIGETAASIELATMIPLADGASYSPLEETRDGWLEAAGRRMAWTAPLAAPEWRCESSVVEVESTCHAPLPAARQAESPSRPSAMEVEAGPRCVTLAAKRGGRAIYLPWFLDFHAGRRKAVARTWRRLTVGEDLRTVPPDAAVGYRVQVGPKQWLVYRALTGPAQRTVLGQHLATEFFFGRFHRTGEVTTYVEVEGP